jgi:hypothetical protein
MGRPGDVRRISTFWMFGFLNQKVYSLITCVLSKIKNLSQLSEFLEG